MIGICSLLAALSGAPDSTRAPLDSAWLHRHRISLEGGYGYETTMWRVGTQHDWRKRRFAGGPWVGGVFVEATAGVWLAQSRFGGNRNIIDIGVTPVWQLLYERGGAFLPYVEAGVGFHHISETRLNNRVGLGTAFQFGDHAGIGVVVGRERRFDVTFRFQHLSNGGVRAPNHGVNFSSLRLALRL